MHVSIMWLVHTANRQSNLRSIAVLLTVLVALTACGEETQQGKEIEPQVSDGGITAQQLVGFWESTDRTQGGIGNYIEFRADGSCTRALCIMVEATYERDGTNVKMAFADAAEKSMTTEVSIQDDVMTQGGPETPGQPADRVEKRRVSAGPADAPAIVGVWTYKHYTGVPAFERYTTDGRMLLRIPMPGEKETTFSVRDHSLKFRYEEPVAIALEDGLLWIGEGSKRRGYRRVKGGAWYQGLTVEAAKRFLPETKGGGSPERSKESDK